MTLAPAPKTPEVFACIADIFGIANVLTFTAAILPYWTSRVGVWKSRLGDPDAEAGRAFLTARSPLSAIDRAFRPILIAQGLDSFFRAGSLVFGGGHVVLPLLQAEVVPPGWVTGEQFVAGYGAAQAVPGPLFTFAAYLGAVMMDGAPGGVAGAALALVAVFLPSFLLVIGVLPFWDDLRGRARFQAALRGINAAVVGLLLAALYHPVWTSAIRAPADVALALAAFGLLAFWKAPAWLVVVLAAGGGALLSLVSRS